jgi:hypothetical protein
LQPEGNETYCVKWENSWSGMDDEDDEEDDDEDDDFEDEQEERFDTLDAAFAFCRQLLAQNDAYNHDDEEPSQ